MTDFSIKQLTEREKQVLSLMAEGLTNVEISQKLNIAMPTTRTHVQNIYSKLSLFIEDFNNKKNAMRVKAVLYYLKGYTNGNK